MTMRPGIGWLDELRDAGRAAFRTRGLPTTKMESWRHTNLRALEHFPFARPGRVATDAVATDASLRALGPKLVFINGVFEPALSQDASPAVPLSLALDNSPEKVRAHLGRVATADEPLATLNAGFLDDGVALLMRGTVLGDPIVVEHMATAASEGLACHPRNLIVLESGARAILVERFSGAGRYLTNPVSEIVLEDGAQLTHVRLFEDADTAFNLSHAHARVGRDCAYHLQIIATGGVLVRDEVHVALAEAGAYASICGIYLARGRQHTDHTTLIHHQAPHTTSRELFKGALDDNARGVFQGDIYVAKGADGTDGQLTNKTLLLSDSAEIDAKPQLEIYADDVKCSHGATAGELEENALFYLRSRGVPEAQARAMLVEGFLDEVFEGVAHEATAEVLRGRIAHWLRRPGLKEAA